MYSYKIHRIVDDLVLHQTRMNTRPQTHTHTHTQKHNTENNQPYYEHDKSKKNLMCILK